MKAPLITLIAIMVCIIGFLVIYSQQHETIATAAPGHGVSGGYGSAPASGGYGSAAKPASGGYGAPPAAASGGYGAPPAAASGGYGAPPATGGHGK
jgi:hypothetical protein